ncbi:MAG TPA: hypothetical protein ENF30_03235 [Candidatus Desulfofervidus auxilii]|uniref:DUF4065 domain-containing protein n=1 Tax=Desulfofervidus auxilii TaxID=1621989 RepID=A0A7V0NEL7_DESA2|nr:hypothetical protein [Candidatus Desulfofervidus auxilii]
MESTIKNISPIDLIHYIVWYATQKGMRLTTLRLVKFLYLADLYWARKTGGETLTNWPWRFIHYGPFCSESLEAIKRAVELGLIKEKTYPSKYDLEDEYNIYETNVKPQIADQLPEFLSIPLNQAIIKWGEDTPALLDYVYFETEPMMNAKKWDFLDFSKAKKTEKRKEIKMLPLSPEKVKKARELVKKIKEKYKKALEKKPHVQPVYDDYYFKALEYLDGDLPDLRPLSGILHLPKKDEY